MEAAERERAGRIRGCESDRDNRERLGYPSEGEFNACIDRAERNYQERALENAQNDVARHADIDEGKKENLLSCLMPNPADLDTPDRPKRSR